jgi:SAM-dependent methyltransferase
VPEPGGRNEDEEEMPTQQTPVLPEQAAAPQIESVPEPAWAPGDLGPIGVHLAAVGESLCDAVGVLPGERVLDLEAGSGSVALAAARRFADVTATDGVPELVEQARRRAAAEGLAVRLQVADAERLPFASGSFDVAVAAFGIAFAPEPEEAADELLRVVRPGGRIGLACWTPGGLMGALVKRASAFAWPPVGLASTLAWGTEPRLAELFAPAAGIRFTTRTCAFRFRSADHGVAFLRAGFGPMYRTFAALGDPGRRELHLSLVALLHTQGIHQAGTLTVPAEYTEAVVAR